MLHEAHLPDFGELAARIAQVRSWGRTLAFHCATAAELAFALAALDADGVRYGDRIEHGSVIDASAIPELAARGLTVVTQPAFIEQRGDRYLATVDPGDFDNLYRCGSLLQAGVRVAGSTDAPYGAADPWTAMRAACTRRTREGRPIGLQEAVSAAQALAMFMGPADDPGGTARRVEPGAKADLCLLASALEPALCELRADCVAGTIIDGELAYLRDPDQASFAMAPEV
jgi:predicted amidohydrolase YtcJ